jgi:hypothetical protein
MLSVVKMVPTGKARVATRIFGPLGTTGSAAICCAGGVLAAKSDRANKAVVMAMTSAPASSAIFLTSISWPAPMVYGVFNKAVIITQMG